VSADGELLAYGCGPLVMVALPTAACALAALRGHSARVNCVRWVPGSAAAARYELMSASCDGTLRVWRRETADQGPGGQSSQWYWREVQMLSAHSGSVTHLAMELGPAGLREGAGGGCYAASVAADSNLIVWTCGPAGGGGGMGGWELGQKVRFGLKQLPVCAALVAGSEDGGMMLLAVGHVDSRIRLFSFAGAAETGGGGAGAVGEVELLCVLLGHSDWVTCLDFREQAGGWPKYLASGSSDSSIRVWLIQRDSPGARPPGARPPLATNSEITELRDSEAAPNELALAGLPGGGGGGRGRGGEEEEGGGGGGGLMGLVRRPKDLNQSVTRHVFSLASSQVYVGSLLATY